MLRRCGEPIHDGRDWCPTHRAQYARTLLPPLGAPEWTSAAPDAAEQPVTADSPGLAVALRCCGWIIDTSGDVFRHCGEPITDGRDYCPTHRAQYAHTVAPPPGAPEWTSPAVLVASGRGGLDWASVFDAVPSAAPVNASGRLILLGQVLADEASIVAGLGLPAAAKRAAAVA